MAHQARATSRPRPGRWRAPSSTRAALAAHDHILAVNPLDYDSRRKIADLLLALGDQAGAREVYRASRCTTSARATRCPGSSPARCSRRWAATPTNRRRDGGDLRARRADAREVRGPAGAGRPRRRDGASRPTPRRRGGRRPRPRRAPWTCPCSCSTRSSSCRCRSSRSCRESCSPPCPARCACRRGRRRLVIREGELGMAFYLVATGEVRVFARAGATRVERGRLHEGSLFGEMALSPSSRGPPPCRSSARPTSWRSTRGVARLRAEVPVARRSARPLRARAPAQEPARDVAAVQALQSPAAAGAAQALRGPRVGPAPSSSARATPARACSSSSRRGRDPEQGRREAARSARQAGGRRGVWRDVAAGRSADDGDGAHVSPTTIMFLGRDYFRRLVQALPTLRQYFEELSNKRKRTRV